MRSQTLAFGKYYRGRYEDLKIEMRVEIVNDHYRAVVLRDGIEVNRAPAVSLESAKRLAVDMAQFDEYRDWHPSDWRAKLAAIYDWEPLNCGVENLPVTFSN